MGAFEDDMDSFTRGQATRNRNKTPLDLAEFTAMNVGRCVATNGFNHAIGAWSLSDWMTATMGELGEAANVVKKLNRERDGIRGNKEAAGVLHEKLAGELADVFIYLNLLMVAAGVDPVSSVRYTFNRKSEEIGYAGPGATA